MVRYPNAEETYLEREVVNPWTWQDRFGFAQANTVSGAGKTVYCAGQTSVDADGNPVYPGDMRAQIGQALDNLEIVLHEAGGGLADVVRLNSYATDLDAYFAALDVQADRLRAAGCRPASTLLGVSRLALPPLLVELEATAVVRDTAAA